MENFACGLIISCFPTERRELNPVEVTKVAKGINQKGPMRRKSELLYPNPCAGDQDSKDASKTRSKCG